MSGGYFDCACCDTIEMGSDDDDTALCDTCKALGCGEDGCDPCCSHCLVDGSQGIYVPLRFACDYDVTQWGISEDDVTILRAGPDNPDYWDTWSNILDRTEAQFDGYTWVLEQDGDLFAKAIGKVQS